MKNTTARTASIARNNRADRRSRAARKLLAARPPEFRPVWVPAEEIAKGVAGMKRAAIQGLLDSSIDADDFATAKLCSTALKATLPWSPTRERLTAAQRDALRKCERLARRCCGNCGEPGAWLCSVCAHVCAIPRAVVRELCAP